MTEESPHDAEARDSLPHHTEDVREACRAGENPGSDRESERPRSFDNASPWRMK